MFKTRQEMLDETRPHQELIEEYKKVVDGKPTTKKSYRDMLARYANYLKIKQIEKPRESDLIAFKEFIRTKDNNEDHGPMAQKFIILLHAFYSWTDDMDYYPNIAKRLKNEKIESDFQRRPLTLEEAKKVIDFSKKRSTKNIECARDHAILMLTILTGLRTIEVAGISLNDFSKQDDKTYVYIEGKGRSTKGAKVLVPDLALDAIQNYLDKRKDKNKFLFINHGHNKKHESLMPQTVSKIIKHLLRCVGIDDIRVTAHSLRHTFATLALNQGIQMEAVSKCLRHKSISTTQIYSHSITRENNNTENVVASLFDSKK